MWQGQHITGALEWPIAPIVYCHDALMCGLTTLMLRLPGLAKTLPARAEAVDRNAEISAENPGVD